LPAPAKELVMPDDPPVLTADDIYPRQKALFDQYEAYLMRTIKRAYDDRGRLWHRDFSSPEAYERSVEPNRRHWLELLGGWPWERGDLNARFERIADCAEYRVERVTYRVFEDVETDAILLTPQGDAPPGGFPAVLCQVGVNGCPETICGFTGVSDATYHKIGSRLAAHGYVVIATRMVTGLCEDAVRDPDHRAPHLMDQTQAEIRDYLLARYDKDVVKQWAPQTRSRTYLNRLCRVIAGDLMGIEMFNLSRGVDVLASLERVNGERIGMYGLSQGGLSALFLGPLEKRLQAVVSSMCFNERYHKQVVRSEHYGAFVNTSSEDHIYPHLREFADSDLASLVCPRAFFVEAGRQDGSVYWKLAVQAFAEAKAIYERLGIGPKCDMFVHEGGHETEPVEDVTAIHAVRFLDRWLRR
jgi:dienelactone hydrolase